MPTTSDLKTAPIAKRPTRADARRNYDALLAAADAAFIADGVDTSLEEIARQAGVAIGTLYRHFPTREALIEAVLHDEFNTLQAHAEALLDTPSPDEALLIWLRALLTHANTYRGLARSMMASFEDERSALYCAHHEMQQVARRLLGRAQDAGTIRADIGVGHVLSLTCALASAIEQGPDDPGHAETLRRIVHDGLRCSDTPQR